MSYLLEVCVDSVQSAVAAREGGADRVELCSALVIGGLSPSPSLMRQVKYYTGLPVRVLLRPRFGDFCYDEYELQSLREEAEMFRDLGADGIVTGVLAPDGSLDVEEMQKLKEAAGDMKFTLHRAFDVCRDPFETMEQCAALGIDTILTSGQKSSAWEGRELLGSLVEKADGRIDILAGAGVDDSVIESLAAEAKVRSFHMSGKTVLDSRMEFRREGVPMGIPGFSEFEIWQTDAEKVKRARRVLDKLADMG